jgi:CrcB protein
MRRPLIVFLGGGIGASLRALLLLWLAPWGAVLPAPVLVANVLGAFVLGLVFVLADEAGLLRAETRLFLAVGVLGGFTTFSTFGWGADQLLARGAVGAALIYLGSSLVGGVVGVTAGLAMARALASTPRARRGNALADVASIEAEDREESRS